MKPAGRMPPRDKRAGEIRACRSQRGYALVMVALLFTALCGILGFGVDLGYLFLVRRHMQAAADAAAIGGVQELVNGSSGDSFGWSSGNCPAGNAGATAAARADAQQNGFQNGVGGVTVTVNCPPLSGPYTGSTQAVEVIIAQSQPTFFMRIFNLTPVTVKSRAVGHVGSASVCIYVLDPSATRSLSMSVHSSVSAFCGVVVNSSSPTAIYADGTSCLSANSISVVGGIDPASGTCFTPNPVTGALSQGDPLATLTPPAVGSCTLQSGIISGTQTLNPGTFCGGIQVNVNATANLNPGTYILYGGGLSVGNNATVTGTGVTFYNTGTGTGGAHPYGSLSTSNNSTLTISAPTSGTYAGILFFQDPNNTQAATITKTTAILGGAIYLKNAQLTFTVASVDSPAAMGTALVVDKLSFVTHSGTLSGHLTDLSLGSQIKAVGLGE